MSAGKVVAKETSSRNFAAPIDNKVGGISGVLEGYLGSGRVAGQVEPGCVEGSDIFAEMLMRRQLICINSAVSEKSSGIQNTPDGHLLLWKCLFCCRITMLQSNSSKIENGFLIKLVGFVAGAVEAKIVRCVMLTK